MDNGDVAFLKGNCYDASIYSSGCGDFQSEISNDHFMVNDLIDEHLCEIKVFKFGK